MMLCRLFEDRKKLMRKRLRLGAMLPFRRPRLGAVLSLLFCLSFVGGVTSYAYAEEDAVSAGARLTREEAEKPIQDSDAKENAAAPAAVSVDKMPGGDDRQALLVDAPNGTVWAWSNLILCATGATWALTTIIRMRVRKKCEATAVYQLCAEGSIGKARQTRPVLLVGVTALAFSGVILFLLSENITSPMVFVDKWTIVNLSILAFESIGIFFVFKQEQGVKKNSKDFRIIT